MKKYITRSYMGRKPSIPESCTVFENCVLMGDVRLGENCVVMPNCVLRADYSPIIIGDNSNSGFNLHTFGRRRKRSCYNRKKRNRRPQGYASWL